MSNEKKEPLKSANHSKPKYVFLDKFERYKVHTNGVISGLEEDQRKTKKLLYDAEKRILSIEKKIFRIALFSSLVLIIMGLFVLL